MILIMLSYLDITKHLLQIVAAAAQRQMVQDVLVHELNVGVAQLNGAIGIPASGKWTFV